MTRPSGDTSRGQRGRRLSESQDPAFYEGLGHAIKVLRTERKMERKELAAAADISYAYLSDIETGRGRPSSAAVVAIAQALGLAPHELLRAAEERQQPRVLPDEVTSSLKRAELGRSSWFRPQERRDVVAPSPQPPARADLDAALDDLPEEDLRLVLGFVRRLARD